MGQKVNPIANRLGYIRGWESNWYSNATDFAEKLIEDQKIRSYLNARIPNLTNCDRAHLKTCYY